MQPSSPERITPQAPELRSDSEDLVVLFQSPDSAMPLPSDIWKNPDLSIIDLFVRVETNTAGCVDGRPRMGTFHLTPAERSVLKSLGSFGDELEGRFDLLDGQTSSY